MFSFLFVSWVCSVIEIVDLLLYWGSGCLVVVRMVLMFVVVAI
jgi:hypothetical protein